MRPKWNPMAAGIERIQSLRRELGLWDAVAVGLGAIVGAGIFVVTGVAAGIAGPAFLVGLLIAAAVATFNALSSAELAAKYPTSGGTYEYGYELLHPSAGFAAGWMFLASKLAAGSTVALGFGSYLAALIPGVHPAAAGVAAVIALTTANLLGIRKVGKLNLAIVAVTVGSLIVFVNLGASSVSAANFEPFAPGGAGTVLQAAALMFFSYTGYARLATLAEEVRDPERTIPRAIVISLGISVVLYLLVGVVAVGAVGAEALAGSKAPIGRATFAFSTPWAGVVVAVGATSAMLGVLLSQILGISRMMLAMARRGDLPHALAAVEPRRQIPPRAVLATGAILLLVTLLGTLEAIIAAAAFTILLYYAIANVAALRLPKEAKRYPRWVSYLGLGSCLTLAAFLDVETILTGLAMLAVGFFFRMEFRILNRRFPYPSD